MRALYGGLSLELCARGKLAEVVIQHSDLVRVELADINTVAVTMAGAAADLPGVPRHEGENRKR